MPQAIEIDVPAVGHGDPDDQRDRLGEGVSRIAGFTVGLKVGRHDAVPFSRSRNPIAASRPPPGAASLDTLPRLDLHPIESSKPYSTAGRARRIRRAHDEERVDCDKIALPRPGWSRVPTSWMQSARAVAGRTLIDTGAKRMATAVENESNNPGSGPGDDPTNLAHALEAARRILLVEDEEDTRQSFQQLLGMALGVDVDLAVDGAQALAMLLKQPYSIVITDLRMPSSTA